MDGQRRLHLRDRGIVGCQIAVQLTSPIKYVSRNVKELSEDHTTATVIRPRCALHRGSHLYILS